MIKDQNCQSLQICYEWSNYDALVRFQTGEGLERTALRSQQDYIYSLGSGEDKTVGDHQSKFRQTVTNYIRRPNDWLSKRAPICHV